MGVEHLTAGLYRVLLGRFQAYLWRDPDSVTLIDTGAADTGGESAAALERIGLTHFHDDHAGGAAEIREWGNVEIVAHKADAPIIRGDVPGPPPDLTDAEQALLEQ